MPLPSIIISTAATQHHLLLMRSIQIEERVKVGMGMEVDNTPAMPRKRRKRCGAEDLGPEAKHERAAELRIKVPKFNCRESMVAWATRVTA